VRLILDSHAFVWWVFGDPQLSRQAQAAIDGAAEVLVGAIAGYEIVLKHALGKWPEVEAIARDVAAAVAAEGFAVMPITLTHAEAAGRLPFHHRDPFDRLLAAQALREDLTLVSADRVFDAYGVRRLW
jgi:PIN domain nuclease of toxin-antitoxin system